MQQSYYGEIYASTYDIGGDRPDILSLYLGRWEKAGRPEPVLDAMCGTGYFLSAFLEAGADVDGVDASEPMLRQCGMKVAGGSSTLYHQRLEEIDLPRRYGFIVIPDRSFSHLYEKEVAAEGLRRFYDQLSPGGTLVLDIRQPPRAGEFGEKGDSSVWLDERIEGSAVFCTGLWGRRDEGRVIRHTVKQEKFVGDELVETEIFDYNERFFDRDEFQAMLVDAGFVNIEASKAYEAGEIEMHDGLVFSGERPL